jgi:L-aspartate oxidase
MQTDVLIIGSGIAGATAALELAADHERQVTVLTRAEAAGESNSSYAQGGIVSRGDGDTAKELVADVLQAGAGLSRPEAAAMLAGDGPVLLRDLLERAAGIEFDRDADGQLSFGLEGAHSKRRILHVGDATGRVIMDALLRAMSERSNIRLLTGHTAVDLITFPHHSHSPLAIYERPHCHGAYVLDQDRGVIERCTAGATILATGGAGQIYLNTSNRPGARGDGLAMAARAGARMVNMEYVQFHPTTLHLPGTTKFLISEAVRGEGAVLLTPEGERFMERYEPQRRELAARDVVARAIYWEMLGGDRPYVLLDLASQQSADFIRARFGEIHRTCLEHGIDITRQPIPVVPAAHYFCGGVLVDLHGEGLLWGTRCAR